MDTNKQTLLIFWQHVARYKRYVFGVIATMPFTLLTHQVLPPLVAANILDRLFAKDYVAGKLWDSFGNQLLLYAALAMFGGTIMWRLVVYFIWKLEVNVQRDLAQTQFIHLMELDADFHANSFGGSLVSRSNKMLGAYVRIADTITFQLYPLLLMFIITAIVLWPRSPLYVVVLATVWAFYIAISILVTKKIRVLGAKEAAAQNKQTGVLADMITNIMAVKSFSAKKTERERYEAATERSKQAMVTLMWATLKRELLFGGTTTGMQAIALAIGTASVVLFNAEVGTMYLILYYTNNITVRLWDFSLHALRQINRGLGDAQEATQMLMRQPVVTDTAFPSKLHVSAGKVEFLHVDFSHDKNELFKDFNLTINPGERVGLVGHSGSGKSTLTKLLLRFMDIQSGQLKIDGQDIQMVTQEDLRRNISYVPQEPLLFHRSLSENIAYGKPGASQEQIESAAKKANAHEFIIKLPKGYKTLVGERGVKLSGGQRQRVAIARAMLKDAPILLLDEATSALDSESEVLIQEALWKLMEGRTAIVIAHRLSTIQKMDRIVVLDNGRIAEEGTHRSLINKNGIYAKLWNHQSGGFLDE